MANAALERVKALKAKKNGQPEPEPKSASKKKDVSAKSKKGATTKSRADVPWSKIVKLYNDGKSTAEISDALDLTRPKTKEGKENPYPYYLVVGYLTKLSHGVEVDGTKYKIVRGSKKK